MHAFPRDPKGEAFQPHHDTATESLSSIMAGATKDSSINMKQQDGGVGSVAKAGGESSSSLKSIGARKSSSLLNKSPSVNRRLAPSGTSQSSSLREEGGGGGGGGRGGGRGGGGGMVSTLFSSSSSGVNPKVCPCVCVCVCVCVFRGGNKASKLPRHYELYMYVCVRVRIIIIC